MEEIEEEIMHPTAGYYISERKFANCVDAARPDEPDRSMHSNRSECSSHYRRG